MGNRTVLEAFESSFHRYKRMSEASIAQVRDADLYERLSPEQNSIAIIIQHLHGSTVSRWTDFLTTDGEKPDRNRDAEFVDRGLPRDALMALWHEAWECLFAALEALSDKDLDRGVKIRGEPHTVAMAIARQLAHCAWHAAQIALLSKHYVGSQWKYLTIPPGATRQFNEQMGYR